MTETTRGIAALARALRAAASIAAIAAIAGAQRPVHAPERVPEGVTIEIDGRLDDPFWLSTVPIDSFTEVVPTEGGDPAVPTAVRVAYDADFLYVAIECTDDPAVVRARLMERDARLDPDDRVELWFDTFDDQRFAYWFQVGAGGSKGDALVADSGRSFNKSWDGIWYAAARVSSHGWTAEIALPFKTLAFRDGNGTWGFNVRRLRKENDAEYRWASPRVAYRFFDLSVGGELCGIEGIRQGVGLDLIPYAKLAVRDERATDPTTTGDWGGDVRYRLTPSLGLQLTYNTDFAETEVDERQVNLTRFPLFFPEKRDFFLEDAGLFQFGAPDRQSDTVPYFSRRIGLSGTGDPVPIVVGGRVSGRAGDWNLGLLEVVLDEQADVAERGVGVARVSRNLGGGSAVGAIYTGGDPNEPGYASTAGVDFHWSDSRAFGDGRSANVWAWAMASAAEGADGDGASYGLQAEYADAEWQQTVSAYHVDDTFDPKLGFVRRRGIRSYRWDARYTWRSADDGFVRRVNWRLSPTVTTSASNETDSWSVPFRWFELTFASEDTIQLETHRVFERIDETFTLRGVPVLPGDYTMTRHFAKLGTAERRPLRVELRGELGDFYDGDVLRVGGTATLLPSSLVQLSGSYDEYHVDLSTGGFVTRLTAAHLDVTPSPYVAWRNLVQYDTDSAQMTLQSRLRWILEPGNEVFLVGLLGWERPESGDASFVPTGSEVTLKLVYTLRF